MNYRVIASQLEKDNMKVLRKYEKILKERDQLVRYCCDIKLSSDLQKKNIEHLNTLIDDVLNDRKSSTECIICCLPLTENTPYNGVQDCNCTMNIHKFCLDKFKLYSHMSCVICRNQIEHNYGENLLEAIDIEPTPPPPPPQSTPPSLYTQYTQPPPPQSTPPPLYTQPPPPLSTPPPLPLYRYRRPTMPIINLISDDEYADSDDYEEPPVEDLEEPAVEDNIPPNPPPTQLSSPYSSSVQNTRNNSSISWYYEVTGNDDELRNLNIERVRSSLSIPTMYVRQPPVSYTPSYNGATDL